ncbi:MAG: hypothetical protein ACU83O_02255 [Gammaproteobacteria bacterium]
MSKQFNRGDIMRIVLISVLVFGGISPVAGKGKPNPPPPPNNTPPTPIQIFGAWHCGNHYCDWSTVRDMPEFDQANHWLIDRGDGSNLPSVNLVVLSFVNPLKMLNQTDAGLFNMIPPGMTQDIVAYFNDHGIRVMLSIGGITYTDDWDAALAKDPTQLGLNAAAVAQAMGVGIEIDYENSSSPNIPALQAFIDAYRSVLPYDAAGNDPAARLTIDVAAGDRWLIELNRYATENWLRTDNSVLDYANAMVGGTSSGTPTNWQEHVDGKPQYSPPVPPLAPAKFTGGLYLKGNNANCLNYDASEQKAYAEYVQKVMPNGAGTTPGMLGLMFWAAESPSARKNYQRTDDCTGGMGVAASSINNISHDYYENQVPPIIVPAEIPIPMTPLRQQ